MQASQFAFAYPGARMPWFRYERLSYDPLRPSCTAPGLLDPSRATLPSLPAQPLPLSYRCLCFVQAFALQSSTRNCSLPPDLVL